MAIVQVSPQYLGVVPKDFARNGYGANASCIRSVANLANHVLAYHGTVLPAMEVLPASARDSASDLRLWTQYYRATPNGTTLVSRVFMVPTEAKYLAGAINPRWYLTVDGVAEDARQHANICATGATLTLDDIFMDEQEITVTAATAHRIDLSTVDNCRVVGWQLYEKDRPALDPATDAVIDTARIVAPGQVLDADWTDVTASIDAAWKQCRGYYGSFNVNDPATPIAATTSYKNIWDASTSRGASTVGFQCPTQYRNSYMGTTVPVVCWALVARTGGTGAVTVRFAGSAANIDVTCTKAIDICTATGTIPAAEAGEKLDVQLQAPSGTTGALYACGVYPLVS